MLRRFLAWRRDHPGRIAPLFCTTTGLAMGRAWHDHGAAHRIPFVVIGVLIALIGGAIGAACTLGGAERVAGYVLAVAAAVWLFAVVGYGGPPGRTPTPGCGCSTRAAPATSPSPPGSPNTTSQASTTR